MRSNSVTRPVSFNRTKIVGKCQNSKNWNETFWVIFKQCEAIEVSFQLTEYDDEYLSFATRSDTITDTPTQRHEKYFWKEATNSNSIGKEFSPLLINVRMTMHSTTTAAEWLLSMKNLEVENEGQHQEKALKEAILS